jgi:hypothetical protein
MTESRQNQQKEKNLTPKSILMTLAWLNFYAFNWFMVFHLPAEHPTFYVFLWILFAVIAVFSTSNREPKEKE